jgi:hypothetical protein
MNQPQLTAEQKRSPDDMLHRRIASGETEAAAISHILLTTHLHNQKEDDHMIVQADGTTVDVRSIRVWASFYITPEVKQ